MSTSTLSPSRSCIRSCTCRGGSSSKSASDRAASELQSALLQAVTGLSQLVSQLAAQVGSGRPAIGDAEPWMEQLTPATSKPRCASSSSPMWDELSVVELRSLLRSYPIDRTSLPAPIELLRRSELIEALNQIQALNP
jgi:hypothetical protein